MEVIVAWASPCDLPWPLIAEYRFTPSVGGVCRRAGGTSWAAAFGTAWKSRCPIPSSSPSSSRSPPSFFFFLLVPKRTGEFDLDALRCNELMDVAGDILPGRAESIPLFLLDRPKVKSPLGDLLRLGSFPLDLDAVDDTDGGSLVSLPLGGETGFAGDKAS